MLGPEPFYTDWKFWSFFTSAVAIVLSQIPPLRVIAKRVGLTVEAYSQLFLLHKYGNPNAQLHLIISNTGGRKVRVTSVTLKMSTATRQQFSLPAGAYFVNQGDKENVLFTPFSLLPGEEWAHIICFFPQLSRQDNRLINESVAAIRQNINAKRVGREDEKEGVRADQEFIDPFINLMKRQFKWFTDEYEMAVCVATEPPNAVPDQRFRFILYESDTASLMSSMEGYAYGAGIYFDGLGGDNTHVELQKL